MPDTPDLGSKGEPRVVDNAAEHRHELWVVDERAGVIEYGTRPGVVELIHTEIDPERQLTKPLNSHGRPARRIPPASVRRGPCMPTRVGVIHKGYRGPD